MATTPIAELITALNRREKNPTVQWWTEDL
jgi:hypothetical protein